MIWNTARDLLKYVYLHVRQYWANYAINTNTYLIALQTALNELWASSDWMRNRSHTKDRFVNLKANDNNELKIITSYPIDRLDDVYYWTMSKDPWSSVLCDCPDDPDLFDNSYICWPCSSCDFGIKEDWTRLIMKVVAPNDNLIPWQMQIAWSEIKWVWWHYWNIIKLKVPFSWPCPETNWLYITYYRWPQKINSFDDIIMIPYQYFSVVAMICAKYLLPIYWLARQNSEIYLDNMIDKQIKKLKEKDWVYPTSFNNKAR